MKKFRNVTVIEHPLISRDLTIVRDRVTDTIGFRKAIGRIATILAYHSLKELPLKKKRIETPLTETTGFDLDTEVIVVPILRAGLTLVDAIINYIPDAKIGHLGMFRDEKTHQPVDYYSNLPSGLDRSLVLLADPMLATGGSADDAITFLKKKGAKTIRFISLISAPEGLERVTKNHPDVPVITASIDEKLNENAFIVPGLGDAGDRFFGTQ
jgi:uracil phosphoribosyltransferase